MLDVQTVAQFFLSPGVVPEDSGEDLDTLTSLKLQKLCYYAQGYHLAFHHKPLFSDPIEAWEDGPAVPKLHQTYLHYHEGVPRIPLSPGLGDCLLRGFLRDVYATCGQFTGWRLAQMTRAEPPWRDTFAIGSHRIIPQPKILDYFKTLV